MARVGANGTRGRKVTDAMLKHAASLGRRPTGVYAFPDGEVIGIQGVSSTLIFDLQSDAGKPAPPLKERIFAGGTKVKMPDETDPAYQQAVAMWQVGKAAQFARVLIAEGVIDWPPEDEVQKWVGRGITNPEEIKHKWIASKLWNDELSSDFFAAVTGLTMPTDEGIDDAEESFPGDGAAVRQPVEAGDSAEAAAAETGE